VLASNDVALDELKGEIEIAIDWRDKDIKRLTKKIEAYRPEFKMDV
jgi:hypothetical protein